MRLLFGSSTSCCNGKHDITLTERIVRERGLGHLLCLGRRRCKKNLEVRVMDLHQEGGVV